MPPRREYKKIHAQKTLVQVQGLDYNRHTTQVTPADVRRVEDEDQREHEARHL
jgi:hypothetical protein